MKGLSAYLGLLQVCESSLAAALRAVGEEHVEEVDVFHTCHQLAGWSDAHVASLAPLVDRYGEEPVDGPPSLGLPRSGGVGLLRDLQDLAALVALVETSWTIVWDAAQGARDRELMDVASRCRTETDRQAKWLRTRLTQAAPQALLVSS